MNLANKYRPQTFEDVVEQGTVATILKKICEEGKSGKLSNRNFLLVGPAGCGKALSVNEDILTPQGFVKMKDIQLGAEVYTHSGQVGKVSGIYPQGMRKMYRITLQDRTHIDVSDEHLNVVWRYNQDTKKREDFCISTTELIHLFKTSRFKLRIDVPTVDWLHRDVPVDPYLLGALIGDGSLADNFQFSNNEPDVIEKVKTILERDWHMTLIKNPGDNVDWSIVWADGYGSAKRIWSIDSEVIGTISVLTSKLADLGYKDIDSETLLRIADGHNSKKYPDLVGKLSYKETFFSKFNETGLLSTLNKLGLLCKSKDKHIPEAYLLNDRDTRIALLQGLFDTDGTTLVGGSTDFTTCSERLSADFAFLVRSLGGRDTIIENEGKYKLLDGSYRYTGRAWTHYIKFPDKLVYCSSSKHLTRKCTRQHNPLRNIVNIEQIEDCNCQCIYVDHPDHTFIATTGFIPTHNTTQARIMANMLNDNIGEPIEIDAASHGGVDSVRALCEQARSYPIGQRWKIFIVDECHAITPAGWSVLLKTLEDTAGRSIFIFATTNPEKIPDTIISRVQTFQLSKISLNGIVSRLKYVLDSEIKEGRQITYSEYAINYISKLANGGMRDALTLTDKVLAYSPTLNIETVTEALGLPDYDDYFELLGAYAKHDNVNIARIIDKVYNSGVNFVKWFEGFHSFVTNVMKYIFLQDISLTMIPSQYQDKISKYSAAHASICLKLSNKLLTMNNELKSTSYLQEIALTHLCSNPKKAGG